MWAHCHSRTMTRNSGPVVDPLMADTFGAFNQPRIRLCSMLGDQYDSGIEVSLGMVNVGQSWTFCSDDIVDGHVRSLSLKNRMPVRVFSHTIEILEDERVQYFGGGN